jgi:hypothetical protein
MELTDDKYSSASSAATAASYAVLRSSSATDGLYLVRTGGIPDVHGKYVRHETGI